MSTTVESIDSATSRALVGGVEAFRFNQTGIISGSLAGFRNKIINGNLSINQRGVSGTVTLAAGAYGHDRFKAGTGGCTYTFAASANGMMLTITAGTLLQIIEGANLEGGTMKLSWFGTATGRVDTGAYGASGVVGTATAGANQIIEFGTGTLARTQYELGSIATTFEQRPYGLELALCQRYYEIGGGVSMATIGTGGVYQQFFYRTTKRTNATITNTRAMASASPDPSYWYQNGNDSGGPSTFAWTASAEL